MTMHLVIPDPHATPDWNNDRFDWLGQLIVDLKPDEVICLGDMADMSSLCSYEKGTKGFEGRRYRADVDSVLEAQERLWAPSRKLKKKMPTRRMLIGNHEHRITRAISLDPVLLDGTISMVDLGYERNWDYVVDYTGGTPSVHVVDGVAYAHYFISGVMGRPINGLHPANSLLVKQFMSCTQGHVHTTDYSVRTTAQGKRIQGLIAGVYSDQQIDYAGVANDEWWRGVIVKRNVVDGQYDPEWISMERLKKEYA